MSHPERTRHRQSVHIRPNIDSKKINLEIVESHDPFSSSFPHTFLQFLSLEIKNLFIAAKEKCDASDE